MFDTLDRRLFLSGAAASAAAVALPRFVAARDVEAAKKELRYHQRSPDNAEPALPDLVQSWITPREHFYVRSHAPNPEIDEKTFAVSVEGMVRKPRKFSLGELREGLPQATATATMTCAGNRRSEHSETKPVSGVPWGPGAIGNAVWGGVPLAEILKRVELQDGAKHVWFESVDHVEGHGPFGGSIPLEKAMAVHSKTPGCLVAWRMNEAPLSPDHGFPVRTVVPGYIGARSVKWLGKIVVSDRPSPNHYVADAYKIVTEATPEQFAAAQPIYQYPINGALCIPPADAKVEPGRLTVRGYALPSGNPGCTIERVEISTDGGRTWRDANLGDKSSPFCWRLWSAEATLKPGETTLVVRATDTRGRTQPQQTPWNAKGYLYNAWHKRQVQVGNG
ncbi:MAG: molybdopterin-dependent oxidoreductase [Planctomycetes bacterium]|nr:molybdopterin-dependent oxidoreductase [Planctomycetota bacterium]